MILYNGNFYTMDEKKEVEAVKIVNDKFVSVGTNKEILALKEMNEECIDLKGKTVIPGFNDSHMHLYSFGVSLQMVDLMNVASIDDLIETTKEFIVDKKIAAGKWIKGRGWNQDYFKDEKRFPNRYDLDKISTEHPIALSRACGHVIVANSKALELCGINKKTPQIEGGKFDIDVNGEPLGIFREQSLSLILDKSPQPTLSEIKATLVEAMKYANQKGVTSIQTDDLSHLPSGDYKLMLQAFEELRAEGKLSCRIYQQCLLNSKEKFNEFLSLGYKTGVGDEYFKIGPLKILSDGSLGARTAALTKPYQDDPTTSGIMCFSQEELDDLILTAHLSNMQVAVHCIGDLAMRMVIDSIAKALKLKEKANHRHGIIHCQIMDEMILNQFKEYNLLAYVQPIFLHYDLHIVEERVGKDLAQTSYAYKKMIDKGIHASLGTDCPVEDLAPLNNAYCAVTRKDLSGYPKEGWNSGERLNVYEAIYHYTQESAYASFEEDMKGSITEGKYADFVVIDKDIFSINENEIKDVKVLNTYLGGKIVY